MKLTELIKMFRACKEDWKGWSLVEVDKNDILELTEKAEKMQETLLDLKALNHHTIEEEMWRIDEVLAEVEK